MKTLGAILAALALLGGCSSCPCPCDCNCSGDAAKAGSQDKPPAPKADEGESLFDGKTLGKWKSAEFGGEGKVEAKDGELRVAEGAAVSGVTWSGGELPKMDYELTLEAKKIEGGDFFCGICFPVGKEHCSLVAGGWGGMVVGLSSIDGMNASENDTTKIKEFAKEKWYTFRLKVSAAKIEAWIDGQKMIDQELKDHQVSLHPAMELLKPLGLATYTTTSAFRNIRLRRLKDGK